MTSISCAGAGSCSAGGYYTDGSDNGQAFVASSTKGVWGNAEEVTGTTSASGSSNLWVISCAGPGNCAATGPDGNERDFVVRRTNGVWDQAVDIPGQSTPSSQYEYTVGSPSISCAAGDLRDR